MGSLYIYCAVILYLIHSLVYFGEWYIQKKNLYKKIKNNYKTKTVFVVFEMSSKKSLMIPKG